MFASLRGHLEARLLKRRVSWLNSPSTQKFFRDNLFLDRSAWSDAQKTPDYDEIIRYRGLSSLKLAIDIPYREMLQEAIRLKPRFVVHRGKANYGWRSLCIHGTAAEETEDYYRYGYKTREETAYRWTEVAEQCPVTVKWLKETWPYDVFHRVRFMLLEPGGFITPHNDTEGQRGFVAVNVALNQPFGCAMLMEDYGIVPWRPGDVRMMDIGLNHSVANLSFKDRYHIIIHGHAERNYARYKDLVVQSVKRNYLRSS